MKDLFATISALLVWCTMVAYGSAAACNDDQIQVCRSADQQATIPVDGHLTTIDHGGHCEERPYVHYTHTCQLNKYSPHTHFCCCAFETRVLCCRYHQSGGIFRCAYGEDTLENVPRPNQLDLAILIPSIAGPIVFILCCIFCCIKCCRIEDDNDDKTRWCWSRKKKKNKSNGNNGNKQENNYVETSSHVFQNSRPNCATDEDEESVPLTDISPDENKCKLPPVSMNPGGVSGDDNERPLPSAPPVEGGEPETGEPSSIVTHNPTIVNPLTTNMKGCQIYGVTLCTFHSQNGHFARTDHGAFGSGHNPISPTPCSTCPGCNPNIIVPPTYEESLKHRIMQTP